MALIALIFLVSRFWLFALGVRSSEALPRMQLVDRDLLAGDLVESLFFLHTQPPLFNGMVGLLLKGAKAHFATAVSVTYWIFGLILALVMYRLLRRLEVPPVGAAVATILFTTGPACLLYETFTLYTYPTAVLLLAATYAAHRYFTLGGTYDAFLLSLLIAAVALTRSLFHLVWVVAAVTLAVLLRRPSKKVAILFSIPFVLVGLVYLKNAALFGVFSGSSLFGLNLYRITTELLPPESRLGLVEKEVLSPFSLYNVNHPITDYPVDPGVVSEIDFAFGGRRDLQPMGWWNEADKGGFVWSVGSQSVLVLPAAASGPLAVNLRCAPFTFPGAPQQTILVRVNGREVATVRLSRQVADHRVEIPSEVLRPTWNTISFKYAYSRSPKELALSPDSRRLGVRWLHIAFDPPMGERVDTSAKPSGGHRETAVLTRVMKRDGGPNLNHGSFPAVMREYRQDAWRVIQEFPATYARAVFRAGLIFLAPPAEHPAFRHKREAIAGWDRLYSVVVYGAPGAYWPGEHSHESRWQPTRKLLERVSWTWLLLALVFLLSATARTLRTPREPANAVVLFALLNILFVVVFANVLEYGENNRFRMMIEPLIWVLVVDSCFRYLRGWRGAKSRI